MSINSHLYFFADSHPTWSLTHDLLIVVRRSHRNLRHQVNDCLRFTLLQ